MNTGLCTGPSHAEPAVMPLTEEFWYFHKSGESEGKVLTPCRACHNWKKLVNKNGPHGYVTIGSAEVHLIQELLDRCNGARGVYRAHGIRAETLRRLSLRSEPVRVQKRTIQRILAALIEQRHHDRTNGGTSERYRQRRREEAAHELHVRSTYPKAKL